MDCRFDWCMAHARQSGPDSMPPCCLHPSRCGARATARHLNPPPFSNLTTFWYEQPTGADPLYHCDEMMWTGLAPWSFEFPAPGSLTSTLLTQTLHPAHYTRHPRLKPRIAVWRAGDDQARTPNPPPPFDNLLVLATSWSRFTLLSCGPASRRGSMTSLF